MAAQKGRKLILQIDKGASVFVGYPGQRNTAFNVTNETVDITNKDNESTSAALSGALHRRLLAQAGVTSGTVNLDGVFTDSSHQAYFRGIMLKNTTISCKVIIPGTSNLGADTYNFSAIPTSLEESGAYNGEVQYSITLETAGEITITG